MTHSKLYSLLRLFNTIRKLSPQILLLSFLAISVPFVFGRLPAIPESKIIAVHEEGKSGQITVTIDPDVMSVSQIERRSGEMVIQLPPNYSVSGIDSPRLSIDDLLKSTQKISVDKTSSGAAIIIHTGNVLFNIQKLPPENTASTSTKLLTHFQTAANPLPKKKSGNTAEDTFVDLTAQQDKEKDLAAKKDLTEESAGIPLEKIVKDRQSEAGHQDGALPRLFFSLLAVLLLAYGFLKHALPALMQRFPALFTRNKADSAPAAEVPAETEQAENHIVEPPPSPQKQSGEETLGSSHILVTSTRFARAFSALKSWIWKETGSEPSPDAEPAPPPPPEKPVTTLNILTSASLGGEKELHLIDVGGRKLVIATLPDQIALLTEFSDDNEASAQQLLDQILPDHAEGQVKAYLEDPTKQEPRTQEQDTKPVQEATPVSLPYEEIMADFEEIYKKYTSDDAAVMEATDLSHRTKHSKTSSPHSSASNLYPNLTKKLSSHRETVHNPPLEAEEVILLSDYEDEF